MPLHRQAFTTHSVVQSDDAYRKNPDYDPKVVGSNPILDTRQVPAPSRCKRRDSLLEKSKFKYFSENATSVFQNSLHPSLQTVVSTPNIELSFFIERLGLPCLKLYSRGFALAERFGVSSPHGQPSTNKRFLKKYQFSLCENCMASFLQSSASRCFTWCLQPLTIFFECRMAPEKKDKKLFNFWNAPELPFWLRIAGVSPDKKEAASFASLHCVNSGRKMKGSAREKPTERTKYFERIRTDNCAQHLRPEHFLKWTEYYTPSRDPGVETLSKEFQVLVVSIIESHFEKHGDSSFRE